MTGVRQFTNTQQTAVWRMLHTPPDGKLAIPDSLLPPLYNQPMNKILTLLNRTWHVSLGRRRSPATSYSSAIHVVDPGAHIRVQDGVLVIDRPGQDTIARRLPDIASLSIHGRAAITTPCVQMLLGEGIPVIWRSASGYYQGQTIDLSGQIARARRAQYAAHGTPLAMDLARRLIGGKLGNMRALLRRRGADDPQVQLLVAQLAKAMRRAHFAPDAASLRGIEGAAGAAYFACWPGLLKGPAAQMDFPGRERRPPGGPVNALLSYCYAVLTGHCATAALAAGLDPADGMLHASRAGRPALALDLVEPFRPIIADATVLFTLNTGEITAADFVDEDGSTSLTDEGRRKLLAALERRLEQTFQTDDGGRQSYREAIDRLATSLAQALIAGVVEPLAVPVRS